MHSAEYPVRLRKANPYGALLPFTDPAKDQFACEKEAVAVLQRLQSLTLAQRAWRDQFGPARSYPLAENRVRFEVAAKD